MMFLLPFRLRRRARYPTPGRSGFPGLSLPLSAQAQTPSRPSGGDKEQKPAKNEGGARPGRSGRPVDRANLVAFRHHQPSVQISVKIAECGEFHVNPYWTALL